MHKFVRRNIILKVFLSDHPRGVHHIWEPRYNPNLLLNPLNLSSHPQDFGIESAYTDDIVGAEAALSQGINAVNQTSSSFASSAASESYASRRTEKTEQTETYTNSARERRKAEERQATEAASQSYSSYKSSRFLDSSASTEFAATGRAYKDDKTMTAVRPGRRSEIYTPQALVDPALNPSAGISSEELAAQRVKRLEEARQFEVGNITDSATASAEAAYYEAMRAVRSDSSR